MKTTGEVSYGSVKKNDSSDLQIKSKNDLSKIEKSIQKKNLNKRKRKKIKKNKSIIKFNDYELNTLHYDEAKKYDKRVFSQLYFSILKTRHILMFSFCPANDFNSRIIKIYLFFYSFAMYCSINMFFFGDSVIHEFYEDCGSSNFIYQIPQIIYSSLISSILSAILKVLSLSEKSVLSIKNEKENELLDEKVPQVLKCLNYKFIVFFPVSFILLLFFWYHLACFCAIYKNTQIHLIKDSATSFGLSMMYPFGLYLLPPILRLPALKDKKGNKKILYKISQIIQLF